MSIPSLNKCEHSDGPLIFVTRSGSHVYSRLISSNVASRLPLLCDSSSQIPNSTMSIEPEAPGRRRTRYRPSIPVPAEIRNHCHIYLDEQLCELCTVAYVANGLLTCHEISAPSPSSPTSSPRAPPTHNTSTRQPSLPFRSTSRSSARWSSTPGTPPTHVEASASTSHGEPSRSCAASSRRSARGMLISARRSLYRRIGRAGRGAGASGTTGAASRGMRMSGWEAW